MVVSYPMDNLGRTEVDVDQDARVRRLGGLGKQVNWTHVNAVNSRPCRFGLVQLRHRYDHFRIFPRDQTWSVARNPADFSHHNFRS